MTLKQPKMSIEHKLKKGPFEVLFFTPELTALRAIFYRGETKIVTITFLAEHLTPLAMAVWIMDDGSAEGPCVRPNTQGFTLKEVHSLQDLLNVHLLPARVRDV